jgi:hypothetical protein
MKDYLSIPFMREFIKLYSEGKTFLDLERVSGIRKNKLKGMLITASKMNPQLTTDHRISLYGALV